MTLIVGAVIVWLVLFAILQWAMKYDAEVATPFAEPIDSVDTVDEAHTESVEQKHDRRVG